MNRQGTVFIPVVVILTFIALLTVYFLLGNKYSVQDKTEVIGVKQALVANTYAAAQKAQWYMQRASEYAVLKALNELAKNGGIIRNEGSTPCGEYMYVLWNTVTQYCTRDTGKSLAFYFNKQLIPYMNIPYFIGYDEPFPDVNVQPAGSYKVSYLEDGSGQQYYEKPPTPLIVTEHTYDQQRYVVYGEAKPLLFPITTGPISALTSNGCAAETDLVDILTIVPCIAGRCKLTPQAAQTLKTAKDVLAAEGITLSVHSAFRTLDDQQKEWDKCLAEGKSEEVCDDVVARPSCTDPHVTGGAIDINVNINTGPPGRKYLGTYDSVQKTNQDNVCKLMRQAGWVGYNKEWWHFEYGTDRHNAGIGTGECAVP